jgi:hypothetical protein
MKITLNNTDRQILDDILTQKDENYTVSQLTNSFLEEHFDAIGKIAVDELMEAEGLTENEAMEEAFYKYLSLDSQDPLVEDMREHTDFGKLEAIPEKEFIDHPFNRMKISPALLGPYQLRYNYFEPYELFNDGNTICDEKSNFAERTHLGYFEKKTPYLMLTQKDEIWMSITPHEIHTMKEDVEKATGNVLTFGLGLGYYAFEVSNKEDVKSVTIIEKDSKVISLFEKNLLPLFPHKEKIKIIRQDAFLYFERELKTLNYDYIFVDIYHTPDDALPLYLRFRKGEKNLHGQNVSYWIEESILCLLRRYVLTIMEEHFQGYTKEAYMIAEDTETEILKKLYLALDDRNFTSIDVIRQTLSDEGLRRLSADL